MLAQAWRVAKQLCLHLKGQALQHTAPPFVKSKVEETVTEAVKAHSGRTLLMISKERPPLLRTVADQGRFQNNGTGRIAALAARRI